MPELGLSREELTEIHNTVARSFDPDIQAEIRSRSSEFTIEGKLTTLDADTPRDYAVLVTFIINAIRANNRRLEEQLTKG